MSDLTTEQGQGLADAWARWNEVGPPEYRTIQMRPCDCPVDYVGPSQVAFAGTEPRLYGYIGGASIVVGSQSEGPPSVVGLFQLVDEALIWADTVDMIYAEADGHPRWLGITWDATDPEEVPERYLVSHLEPFSVQDDRTDLSRIRQLAHEALVALWNQVGVDDYAITVAKAWACPRVSYRVEVRDGQPVAADWIDAAGTDPTVSPLTTDLPLSVADLFALGDPARAGWESVWTLGDFEWGFPISFRIDPDRDATEDDIRYDVTEFTPL